MEAFLVLIVLSGILVIQWYRRKSNFWSERNVPFVPSNLLQKLRPTKHSALNLQDLYNRFKGKYPLCGIFVLTKPYAVALDLELLKCIFVKDFSYFHDRGIYYNEKDDPLSAHLFNLEGAKWRKLRNKISPTFTSSKLKIMFPTILAAGYQFSDYMEQKVETSKEFELKDLLARFTTDVIGMCAFGLECNSMQNPDCEFRRMGRRYNEDPRNRLKDTFCMFAPRVARWMGLKQIVPDVSEFFLKVVRETVDYRLHNNIQRNDFMNLLISLLKGENNEGGTITFNELAAQAFVFFIAGYETSSNTLTWALYELSMNKDVQERGRQCVNNVLEKYNGKLSYEAIMEMNYIEQIIQETLRKYPPVPTHFREVSKDYQVPYTTTVLPAGTSVIIPVYAVHHDSEIFPDPEHFDPDRFTEENIKARHPYAWTPFGEGPRTCVGMRFGLLQARIGLALLLKRFSFSTGPRSTVPLPLNKNSFMLSPEGGLWLKVTKL